MKGRFYQALPPRWQRELEELKLRTHSMSCFPEHVHLSTMGSSLHLVTTAHTQTGSMEPIAKESEVTSSTPQQDNCGPKNNTTKINKENSWLHRVLYLENRESTRELCDAFKQFESANADIIFALRIGCTCNSSLIDCRACLIFTSITYKTAINC